MSKTKDELIAEASFLGLSDGRDLVNMTKAEIQAIIDEAKPVSQESDKPTEKPVPPQEPETSAVPVWVKDLKNENESLKLSNLQLAEENDLLKKQLKDLPVKPDMTGKDRETRMKDIKGKIDGQVRGYYKMGNFDFQELLSLL